MKLKRLLASVLALLLVVSILPIGALAVDIETGANEEWVNNPIDNNRGTIVENVSTITNNGTSGGSRDSGTVNKNAGTITNNYGTVQSNASADGSFDPKISHNHGLVVENNGLVENNRIEGEVATNNGTVSNNNGQVGATKTTTDPNTGDEIAEIVSGTGNFGTITTNGETGTVLVNQEGGTVVTNAKGGTIEVNAGMVGVVDEEGERVDGYGNFGTVKTNAAGGVVTDNSGSIGTNEKGAEVLENWGTIGANSGKVDFNGTTQYEYDGSGWKPLDTPAIVNNLPGGEVVENYGLVNNEAGGFLNDMILSEDHCDEEGNAIPKYKQFEGEKGTYVGTWVDRGYIQNKDGSTEEFQDGGVMMVVKQAIQGAVLNLKEVGNLFKKDGYEVIGYTTTSYESGADDGAAEYALMALDEAPDYDGEKPEKVTVYSTDYEVKKPQGWLSLIWGKIKTAVKPSGSSDEPETKTVQNNIPNSLSAGQVTEGAYVRRGNALFRIIEVGDDYIRVATVGKLSEKSLADMMGFLKLHLSAAQIAKINGEPKLLEQELVTQFFGDTIDHISFYAAPDLFE